MPKMIEALLSKKIINVDDAVDLRNDARHRKVIDPDFRCTECNQPVRPHRKGGKVSAHFEHLDRNSTCSNSHKI